MSEEHIQGDYRPPEKQPDLLSNDAELIDLIDFFISDLQVRVGSIEKAWGEGQYDDLRAIVHQLKVAVTGQGYSDITRISVELETLLMSEDPDIGVISERTQALMALCRQVSLGSDGGSD